ncbi:MAG: HAD-IC family P-type ATPase, partial [candidate division Zixibacteria bacterium]|nr:HAD-IC family P-type ATPase [candidate division Zixibacteria bacterium]
AILSERRNMIYKGTSITRGSGAGIVVATGMATELGKISELVEQAEDESTPLEKRLDTLGHKLIWVTLAITTVVAILGIVRGKEVFLMIESGIALAVAAIPEGLPIVATIALARGMIRMARKNALINRLASVETLGATDIICSDKTGTLTENKMTATKLVIDEGELTIRRENGDTVFQRNGDSIDHKNNKLIMDALTVGVLCNNASLTGNDGAGIGDPMEVALLEIGSHAGIDRDELLKSMPEVHEEAFDPEVKMMATIHENGGEFSVAVKGAPEAVLNNCSTILTPDGEKEFTSSDVEVWNRLNEEMARNGTRMLALAEKKTSNSDIQPYEDLTFLGLIGLKDPPRIDVQESIRLCGDAGINVVMVTGDQPATALNIAKSIRLVDMDYDKVIVSNQLKSVENLTEEDRLDILDTKIFSRVSPKQKLDLIAVHQTNGSIVAMTGDGVNDAPALKKADIGIAMGQRGTQVAREAADMILKDDAFSSIVEAVKQGRIIFDNIRKFVLYLLSCNVSEIMIVGVASIANTPLPILPLQILFLNLVTDVFPALALGVGGGDPRIMSRPPRKSNEPIITKGHWLQIGLYGALLTVSVLSAFLIALYWYEMDETHSVTISFLTLAFGQLVHVFNMRDQHSGVFKNEITRNGWIWAAIVLCIFMIFFVLLITPAANVLKLTAPNTDGWMLIIIFSLVPLIIGQIFKLRGSK